MKKRSWAFALSCLFAVVDSNAPAELAPARELAGPVRPCGACRVTPPTEPVENASEPGLAPRAPDAPVEVETLAGPIRPCGACRREGPRGASTPPPPA